MTNAEQIVMIGEAGPVFKLKDGMTRQTIMDEYARHSEHREKLPLACRFKMLGGHDDEVIGEPYFPPSDGDYLQVALLTIRNSDTRSLVQCKRCGRVATLSLF
jgi:hypothetical protein